VISIKSSFSIIDIVAKTLDYKPSFLRMQESAFYSIRCRFRVADPGSRNEVLGRNDENRARLEWAFVWSAALSLLGTGSDLLEIAYLYT